MKKAANIFLRRKWLIALIVIAIILAVIYFVNSRNSTSTTRNITTTVAQGSIALTVSSSGNIQAARQETGTFSTSSTSMVTEVDVKPGDTVKKGQVLAKIDDSDLQNKLLSADVSLQTAKNNLNNTLVKGKYTDYDILNLKQSIKVAQSNYDLAKKNLSGATLTADFDGVVASVDLQANNVAGTSSIVVYDPTSFYVAVNFTEYDLSNVKVDMPATITIDSLNKSYVGKLTDVSLNPVITSNVVSYPGKISIVANDGLLRLGFSGKAVITLQSKDNVITVPTAAIKTDSSGQNYVTVIKNGQDVRTDIQIGLVGDTATEVTSGLNVGDVVLVSVVTNATTSSSASTGSALQLFGGGGAGGNFTRGTTGGTTRTLGN
jgi:membrane fusion protein, macrolide-specific efflux system